MYFGNDDPTRDLFEKYYMLLAEMKDFNALIDNKPVFDQPVKKQKRGVWETYRNVKKWRFYSRKFISLFVSSKLLQTIGIDLTRQINTNIRQQINFTGKLEDYEGGTMFFIAEKQKKNSKFFFKFINCNGIT